MQAAKTSALHALDLLVGLDERPPDHRQTDLEAAEHELKWALREVRGALGTAITKDGKHQCSGMGGAPANSVYRQEGIGWWAVGPIAGHKILVTHCPWCGTLLEPVAPTMTDGPREDLDR